MLCSNCKKKQAAHAIDRDGGEKIYLCSECYEKLGDAVGYFSDEPDFFVSFLQPQQSVERSCSVCGTTLAEYSRTGLVGCAHCYTVFRADLMPAIARIHGKTEHTGKHPLGDGRLFELLAEQKKLRVKLEQALKDKKMKEAERLNRDIREIGEIISRGGFGDDDQ